MRPAVGPTNTPALVAHSEAAVANSGSGMSLHCLGSSKPFLTCSHSGSTDAYCGSGCQSGFGTCTGTQPPPPTPSSTLSDCLGSKNVPVRFISSPDFPALAKPYNLRLPYTPAVIVLPTTVKHVSDAVVCASQNGVKVQAKSGGHSYASYAYTGQNGGMTIDLQNFQEVSLDGNNIAKVGGGVRLGNMALGIYNNNNAKRALPHGTCPGVGVGGHATHGGFGYSSRNWGLTLDTITAMDVVLANGSSIHTTPTSYPDIYYVRSSRYQIRCDEFADMAPGTSRCGRLLWHRDKLLFGNKTGSCDGRSVVFRDPRDVLVGGHKCQCILEYPKLCTQPGGS